MSSLGKVVVSIEAEHLAFLQGMQQTMNALKQFQDKKEEVSKGGIGSLFGIGAAAGIGSAIGEGIGSAISAVGDALKETVEIGAEAARTLGEWVAQAVEAGDQAFKLASALNVPTQSLTGLAAVAKIEAGESLEDFGASLQKMEKNLGEAATKGGETAEVLERMGLHAGHLANLHPDEAFLQIADALEKVHNKAEQTEAIEKIFGKAGARLQFMLQHGRAGLEAGVADAVRFGAALNDVDAAKLYEAELAVGKMGQAFDGIKNQLAIALAPLIKEFSDKLLSLIPSAEKVRAFLTKGLHAIAEAAGKAWDKWEEGKRTLAKAASGMLEAIQFLLVGIDELVAAFEKVKSWGAFLAPGTLLIGAVKDKVAGWAKDIIAASNLSLAVAGSGDSFAGKAAKTLEKYRAELDAAAKSTAKAPDHFKGVLTWFDGVMKKFDDLSKKMAQEKNDSPIAPVAEGMQKDQKKIDQVLAELQDSLVTFGMTEAQKKLFTLTKAGGNEDEIAAAQRMQAELDKQEKYKKDKDAAKELIEQQQSAVDKYKEMIDKLKKFREEHLLSQRQYLNGVAKANKDLHQAMADEDKNRGKAPSLEVRRFDFRLAATEPEHKDPIEDLGITQKKANEILEVSRGYLSEIYRFLNNSDQQAKKDTIFGV